MRRPSLFVILPLLFLAVLDNCKPKSQPGTAEHLKSITEKIDDAALANVEQAPGDWLTYGRNYSEDRFSPLDQITTTNVDSLGLAWSLILGTKRGIETTPLVVDGILFLSGPWSLVYAVDARTGKMLWKYDPEVPGKYG